MESGVYYWACEEVVKIWSTIFGKMNGIDIFKIIFIIYSNNYKYLLVIAIIIIFLILIIRN